MRILVLMTDYPRPEAMRGYMFAHVRNLFYAKAGVDVRVLSFASKDEYEIDGIKVIPLSSYLKTKDEYDLLVAHSANLRNHYLFIKRFEKNFAHFAFFFHGHESLYTNESYPQPYWFSKKSSILWKIFIQSYDFLKLKIWARYYKKLANKSEFLFVSDYIFEMFKKNMYLRENDLCGHCHVIHNSIGEIFEQESYDVDSEKKYDFITIRSIWDNSTYCVDLVVKLAKQNPDSKFLLIGRGKYFVYNECPPNLTLIDRTISHKEMIGYLNSAKCAINLTRQDTQGVMTCEMVAFGIPVITSDIQICRELYSKVPNLRMISNQTLADINEISNELQRNLPYSKPETFFAKNTIQKELDLFINLCEK